MKCPHCGHRLTRSEVATLMSSLAKNPGRPRSENRCPCGATTMQRAKDTQFLCCRAAGIVPGGVRGYTRQ